MTSFTEYKLLKIQQKQSYLLVGIKNPPVNAMTRELWTELLSFLNKAEKSKEVRGLIFYSALNKPLFTAGNDLNELYAPKTTEQRYTDFWVLQNTFMTRLFKTPLITVAALIGYVPAGGCGLALCCDYRIISSSKDVPNSAMGLNEVQIGIIVPKFWGQLLLNTAGRKGEIGLLTGKVFSAEEALEIGLVNEVTDASAVLKTAEDRMAQFLKVPDVGRILTKQLIRSEFAKEWEEYMHGEAKDAWNMLSSEEMVAALGGAMRKMSEAKKSKL